MLGLRRPENFTHRKAASINYETYNGRGDMTKQKKSQMKFTAKLNARGHRFCEASNFRREARLASRRAMFPPPLPFRQLPRRP